VQAESRQKARARIRPVSTNYSALNPLFSSIRVEDSPSHSRITLWIEGKNIGELTIGAEQRRDFLALFFTREDVVCKANGKVVAKPDFITPQVQLLSEYGDVVTFEDIDKK
jgi:hypothetical protein